MQTDVKKVFYFHADANALGGFEENPFTPFDPQAGAGLPSVGGHHRARAAKFAHKNIVSSDSTYAYVHGQPHQRNGPWTERITSVVENLNILEGLVTADRAVARILVQRQNDGTESKLSFLGAHFKNLQVDGKPVTVTINGSLMPTRGLEADGDCYREDAVIAPEIPWSTHWKVAHSQSQALKSLPGVPSWVADRYGWVETPSGPSQYGYAVCSLVDSLGGVASGKTYGHILEIEDKGRIFFGEIMVNPHSTQLTMVRAELGCKTTAQVTAAIGTTNGNPQPPP